MLRLFFALQPTPQVAERLLEEAAPLLMELGASAVPVGNLHATLCFVGAVAPERLDALREAAAAVHAAPWVLEFDEFDYWNGPRVLVASASASSPAATTLSQALNEKMIGAGFAPDVKPFRPHLTLARKIPAARAESVTWPRKISPGFVVRADEFVLMESRRGEQGSIYSVVESWPLYEEEER